MSEATAPPVIFKKRNKGSAQSRRTAGSSVLAGQEPEASTSATKLDDSAEATGALEQDEDDDGEGTPSNLAELIALRKLRQSTRKEGIDLERLNAGNLDAKRKKKRKAAEPEQQQSYGLIKKGGGSGAANDADSDDDNEGDSITRKIMKTNNFTHQTGIVDVDKHMMAYIEKELQKRRGKEGGGDVDTEKELQALDPHDELYRIAEKYRTNIKAEDEGNVATSSAMLTAIPEVDLGIDSRLKNIEDTEKAKKKLQELRARTAVSAVLSGGHDDYHEATYAGSRFFRHARGNQTEFDALQAAKIEAGIEDEDSADEEYEAEMKKFFENEKKKGRDGRLEIATDDIVAERFRRKGLLNPRGRGRGKR